MNIFDKRRIRLHRNRASVQIDQYDLIIKKIYQLIAERLHGHFPFILNLGAHTGQFLNLFSRYDKIINTDMSEKMLQKITGTSVACDEEFIPFKPNSFDAIISASTLHRVNDLPGSLRQIFNTLKPNGIFIGTVFGVSTLCELKESIIHTTTGSSPMVYPFIDVKDAGMLLQRAGFNMAVSDTDSLLIKYHSVEELFADLRYTGETNALQKMRKTLISKSEINKIKKRYKENFADHDNAILATLEIVTMTGMKNID